MQKLYALMLLLLMALVACTPAAQQQTEPIDMAGNGAPRFLISHATW